MSEYSDFQSNGDINNNYYNSEVKMASLIDTMVSYEASEDGVHYTKANLIMDNTIINIEHNSTFNPDMIAENNHRIIIQQKFPLDEKDCSICLNSLFHKQVAYLPCKHYFHYDCLTQAFNNRLYTCPLCRIDLTQVLHKIGFEFPPVEPEQITDLDLDLIYRLLESSIYYPEFDALTQPDTSNVDIDFDITNYTNDNSLLYWYRLEFNMDDIERMMNIIDPSYVNSGNSDSNHANDANDDNDDNDDIL